MKIIITKSQHKLLIEQSDYIMDKRANALANTIGVRTNKDYKSTDKLIDKNHQGSPIDPHTLNAVLAIGTAFIPVVGPFISAGIGMYDAKLYYDDGDKKTAGLTAALSMLPFIGSIITKIPGVKQLGVKGMALLASKLGKGGSNLTKAELEIAKSIKNWEPQIQKELMTMAPKLKRVVKELDLHKSGYVKKYGEDEYNKLLAKFLYNTIDETKFLQTLKTAGKTSNIKIKPILGGGADHKVFQSTIHPDRVIKAEIRPGEVEKWYDLFNSKPKVFAKTMSKTNVRDTDGTILRAVVMEKLNTTPFIQLWDNIEGLLSKMPGNSKNSLEYVVKHISDPTYRNQWNNLVKYTKQQQPNISGKIDEFYNMVEELYKITPNPDIRKFNLGYDGNGVLKALDI